MCQFEQVLLVLCECLVENAPTHQVGTTQALEAEFKLALLDDGIAELLIGGRNGANLALVATEGTKAHLFQCTLGCVCRGAVILVECFSIHEQHVGIAEQGEVHVALVHLQP